MFDEQKAQAVCEILSTEPVSLNAALRRTPGTSKSEFNRWLQDETLPVRDWYARARESQGDVDADAIADVRRKMLRGTLTPEQARVAIDSLKWSAGKRKPKVYGDKLQVDQDTTLRVVVDDPTRVVRQVSAPAALQVATSVATLIAKEDPSL